MKLQESRYGTWESPLSAQVMVEQSISIKAIRVNENSQKLYYLRGDRNGRFTIIETADGLGKRVLPHDYSVGNTVNGYGGGAFAIDCRGNLIFSDAESQDVCLLAPDTMRVDRLLRSSGSSYADFDPHPYCSRYILAIKEQPEDNGMPTTTLVVIDAELKREMNIRSGSDFYTHPRFSPDGRQICWIQWSFPDMPWSGAVLCRAEWIDVAVANVKIVPGHCGVSQPRWGLEGSLFFASEVSGAIQLHRIRPGEEHTEWVQLEGLEEVEFAGSEFCLGSYTYFTLTLNSMIATYAHNGINRTIIVDLSTYSYADLQLPLIDISYDAMRRVSCSSFAIIGSTTTHADAIYHVSLRPDGNHVIHCESFLDLHRLPIAFLSKPETISFPRTFSNANTLFSHGFFMPPTNPNFRPVPSTLPPCIIFSHGGPTKHARPSVNLELQFLTSRGYAVAILNYAGSTSYGREYRDRLTGHWGVEDVNDAASCRAYLVEQGMIDGLRVGIMGGSAGGYLALQALCTYPQLWAGGISFCGISDMEKFAQTTHKFEKCYDDLLIFGGSRGQSKQYSHDMNEVRKGLGRSDRDRSKHEVLLLRSPIHVAKNLRSPVLLLQGEEDKVVVAEQANHFYDSVPRKDRHLVERVFFPREGHGFRLASSVKKSLELQEWWWRKCLIANPTDHQNAWGQQGSQGVSNLHNSDPSYPTSASR